MRPYKSFNGSVLQNIPWSNHIRMQPNDILIFIIAIYLLINPDFTYICSPWATIFPRFFWIFFLRWCAFVETNSNPRPFPTPSSPIPGMGGWGDGGPHSSGTKQGEGDELRVFTVTNVERAITLTVNPGQAYPPWFHQWIYYSKV